MLCGCVPIVSRVAALPEIVGDAGFILDRRDPNELAALITRVLTLDTTAYSAAARERIMREYPPSTRQRFLDLVVGIARKR